MTSPDPSQGGEKETRLFDLASSWRITSQPHQNHECSVTNSQ